VKVMSKEVIKSFQDSSDKLSSVFLHVQVKDMLRRFETFDNGYQILV
jgi:hypothetical protein